MINPRWYHVLRDLASHFTRTLLVVLSIAVGVFAFGVIISTRATILDELRSSYGSANPATLVLVTDPFGDDLVKTLAQEPEVGAIEARRLVKARIQSSTGAWYDLQLAVVPDFDQMRVGKLAFEKGTWPPPKREMIIERSSFATVGLPLGQPAKVEMPGGDQYQLRLAGEAHDTTTLPVSIARTTYGYITTDTAEWLGLPRTFNQLQVVLAEPKPSQARILEVKQQLEDRLKRSGRELHSSQIPGPHPAENNLPALLLILTILGGLALLLSSFLIVNTITAILAQQTRQIGILKSIGAHTRQITRLYVGMVIIFGALAIVLSVPLAVLGANRFAGFISLQLNFDINGLKIPLWVFALEITVGLLVPILTALQPILATTRISVREAITDYGISGETGKKTHIDHALERIKALPRPLLLSLRNTFRRKGRLIRTLAALVLSGAIFMSVLTVRASLFQTLSDSIALRKYDAMVTFNTSYRVQQVEQEARAVPGVTAVESWGYNTTVRKRPDGSQSDTIILHAPPANTKMIEPNMIQGRWLLEDDANAVVVSSNFFTKERGLKVGDTVVLTINEDDYSLIIVGVTQELQAPNAPALLYMNNSYYTRIVNTIGRTNGIRLTTAQHNSGREQELAQAIQRQFDQHGLPVRTLTTIADDRDQATTSFGLLTSILAVMSLLIGVVGGLGLMGTMSINVIERTREIGIMRAIGASNGAVQQIVICEGLVIGLIAWVIGAAISLPMSRIMSIAIGTQLIQTPLHYTFNPYGPLIWLAVVLGIAALASFVPARRASSITVREVLSYG